MPNQQPVAEAWDIWWRGSGESGLPVSGGPQDPALESFWRGVFETNLPERGVQRLLDIGCGAGAVTGFAKKVADEAGMTLEATCLDAAPWALGHVKEKHPEVTTVEASADDLPLGDGSFDLVCSQFGLEYAGLDAINEACRVVAPGGTLALVTHLRGGAIDVESSATVAAIDELEASSVFPALQKYVTESTELRKGQGTPVGFELADRALNPCVKVVEKIITERGRECAGGMIFSLYRDIAHIYQNLNSMEPEEVFYWIERAQGEMAAFSDRMKQMLAAGLSEAELEQAKDQIKAAGLQLQTLDQLRLGGKDQPAAWVVAATRPA